MSSMGEHPILQGIGHFCQKAVEAAGSLIDFVIGSVGTWLDNNLTPALGALGDKIGNFMGGFSMGGNKLGGMSLNPFGKNKELSDGPSQEIKKEISPSISKDVEGPSSPVVRNEKFDQILSANNFKFDMPKLAVLDVGADYGLSAATSVGVGKQQSVGGLGMA